MRLATIKLQNDKTKQVMKVNLEDWSTDLGKTRFAGWSRLGERHDGMGSDQVVANTPKKTEAPEPKKDPVIADGIVEKPKEKIEYDISSMKKDEMIKIAKEVFNTEIDPTKNFFLLRKEFSDLVNPSK